MSDYYVALLRQLETLPQGAEGGLRAIGVTSCRRREGVSTVAANLALGAAWSRGQPTLLVDANVHAPAVTDLFQVGSSPGLSEYLAGSAELKDCVRKSSVEHLQILPAGRWAPENERAACAGTFARMLESLKAEFATVIVDLPAASDLSICFALAPALDGVLLVVESDRVPGHTALRVKQRLEQARANLLGVVFNNKRRA